VSVRLRSGPDRRERKTGINTVAVGKRLRRRRRDARVRSRRAARLKWSLVSRTTTPQPSDPRGQRSTRPMCVDRVNTIARAALRHADT